MSLMAYFCAAFFPLDVLDEIWDLTESVSEVFPTYSWMDDSRFYVLYNSISVISDRWAVDNERLCTMGPLYG